MFLILIANSAKSGAVLVARLRLGIRTQGHLILVKGNGGGRVSENHPYIGSRFLSHIKVARPANFMVVVTDDDDGKAATKISQGRLAPI